MDIHVNVGSFAQAPATLLERAVRLTLISRAADAAEISLTLMDDRRIADLNERYLGKDAPTDVLAFSLGESGGPPGASRALLGDVYVGFEQASRQAAEHDVPLDEELARLAIHGTLHVLGHDHPEGPERVDSPMFRLQERLVGELFGRAGRSLE